MKDAEGTGEERGEILAPEEAKERIRKSRRCFNGVTINGSLLLGERTIIEGYLDLGRATIEGDLDLGRTVIKGFLSLTRTVVKGNLYLGEATIEGDLYLGEATIEGDLDLERAVIKGDLYFEKATIKGSLDLSTKEGPTRIYVDLGAAKIVHWAAPRISLVISKKS